MRKRKEKKNDQRKKKIERKTQKQKKERPGGDMKSEHRYFINNKLIKMHIRS